MHVGYKMTALVSSPSSKRSFMRWPRFLGRLSLSLQFAAAAFFTLCVGMTGLGFWVSSRIEQEVVQNTAINTAFYMDSLIEPLLQPLAHQNTLTPDSIKAIDNILAETQLGRTIAAIKVWGPSGVILYSNEKELIGKSFPETHGFKKAMTGRVAAEFNDLEEEENVVERKLDRPLLEVYAPIQENGTLRIIAVAEMYQFGDDLAADIRGTRQTTILLVGGFTLGMLLALYGIVRRGSRTIDTQRDNLEQRIGELARLLQQNEILRKRIIDARKQTVETNERLLRRIGADLHDGPAQHVALALLLLGNIDAEHEFDGNSSLQETFETVQNVLGESITELRTISAGIAPPELQGVTLRQAIELAARNHEKRTGTKVDCHIEDLPADVSPSIKTALYRFTQEGLTNAFRHAAGIGQTVIARVSKGQVEVEVVDAGPGMAHDFKSAPSALGLAGLRDRLESLGGSLEIKTQPGSGTRLITQFVLAKEAPSHV